MVEIIKSAYVVIILFFLFLIGTKIEGKFYLFILNFLFYFIRCILSHFNNLIVCFLVHRINSNVLIIEIVKSEFIVCLLLKRKCINKIYCKYILAHELFNPIR